MFVATVVVTAFLVVALSVSASGKLMKQAPVMEIMRAVGVKDEQVPLLAGVELLGAAGLVVGLFFWPLGAAAAVGVVLYFAGAVAAHLRVKDTKGVGPAAFLTLVAVAALVLRVLSR